jgi:Pet100
MAKGRQGFLLEGWKFAIYLLVPITASIYYNNPENQKKSADYWQYIKYPANPSTGWKEQIDLMQSQQKQREVYRQQLQQLNDISSQSSVDSCETDDDDDETKNNHWRWLRWIGLGPKTE